MSRGCGFGDEATSAWRPRQSSGARVTTDTMSQSPGDWYKSLPPVCRAWGTACVLTTVGVQLGVLDLRALYLDFPSVFTRFQIWRLLTNFCFVGGFGFPFVMRIMMMCVSLRSSLSRPKPAARAHSAFPRLRRVAIRAARRSFGRGRGSDQVGC